MPSHSHSSHSSSSHSSGSRSVSSHSSSSHSSSYRSTSSHSSSSYSSSYRSGSRGSSAASPYRSRAAAGASAYVRGGSMKGQVVKRERRNQPTGYVPKEHAGQSASMHYCRKHNYVYYPVSWTDGGTGRQYRRGYYDENGAYYETVVFRRNGEYNNVHCVCDYCGAESFRKLDDGTSLICSQCGANLRIASGLDEYTQDPAYTREAAKPFLTRFFSRPGRVVAAAVLALLLIAGASSALKEDGGSSAASTRAAQTAQTDTLSNVEIFGQTIYLDALGGNAYAISEDGSATYDKKLSWDYGEDCYYDRASDCFVWYNTDVSPNLWQYWYNAISPDYASGWMEYEPDGWYIETDDGNWIALPSYYDGSALWHFEIDPDDFG